MTPAGPGGPNRPAPSAQQRLQSLDVLRGIAILLVLGRHLDEAPRMMFPPLRIGFDIWRECGWTGVDLFFVLSGFLISGLMYREYQKTGAFRPCRFLVRRGFKLYPQYYLLVAAVLIQKPYLFQYSIARWYIAYQVLFIQNYFGSVSGHTWSLAVEEHFYILLAVLFWFRSRQKQKSLAGIPRLTALTAAGVLGFRICNWLVHPYDFLTHHTPTHLRIDSLLFGVLLGYWYHYDRARLENICRRYRVWMLAASMLLLLPAAVVPLEGNVYSNTIGFTAVYAAYGGLLLLTVFNFEKISHHRTVRAVLAVLAAIGFYSYSIYIWHAMVFTYFGPWIEKYCAYYVLNKAACVGAAVLFGTVAALIVEFPMLRLRERLVPSRAASLRLFTESRGSESLQKNQGKPAPNLSNANRTSDTGGASPQNENPR